MKQPTFLHKASSTPTPGAGLSARLGSAFPAAMLERASRRLGHAALLYAAVFFLAYFGSYFVERWAPLSTFLRDFATVVAAVSILLGLAVYLISRYASVRSDLLLDLGLIFEVVGAFGISVTNVWGVFPDVGNFEAWMESASRGAALTGIPWECIWIIIFPLIAPNTPGKVLLASLAAASAGPLTWILAKSVGATSPDVPVSAILFYYGFTTYLCAGIAFVISHGIYRFGRRLKKAQEIGSYQLTKRLGVGGMGEVWLARHRMLARPAAIKLIRPETLGVDEVSRQTLLRRFEREAQATATLRSYHTIELYDFGVTDEGSFYYVMELLDGLNLKALVEQFGPVPAERAAHLLRQACHSLGEAHDRGMIHRDIKPANIFACRLGPDSDFVKVLDFGLVKANEDVQSGATELTAAGVVAGTPAFMAPEIAMGSRIDGRADIYGLGCVGYWLLTGQPVFEGDTPLSIVLQHVKEQPVPPSMRTEIDLPESLDRVILSCLEKDPANRPQAAGELENRLAACRLEQAWSPERAEEWWRLHIAPVARDEELEPGVLDGSSK